MEIKTYYDILGVSFNCNEKDIRKAFKSKSLELHPDKCKVSNGHLFSEMKQAYDTLVDITSRTTYDLLNNIRLIESQRNLFKQCEVKSKIDKTLQEKDLENQNRIREVQEMKRRMDEILRNEKKELLKAKLSKDLYDQKQMVNEMKRQIEELQRIERDHLLKAERTKEFEKNIMAQQVEKMKLEQEDRRRKEFEENRKKQQTEKIRIEQEHLRQKVKTMLNLKLMKKQEIQLRKEIKQNEKLEAEKIRAESQLNKNKEKSFKIESKTSKTAKDKDNKTKKTIRSKSKAERMCQRMKSKSFYYSAAADFSF